MSTEQQTQNTPVRFTLYLPREMKGGLKERAAKNRRTMNSELIHMLEEAMERSKNSA